MKSITVIIFLKNIFLQLLQFCNFFATICKFFYYIYICCNFIKFHCLECVNVGKFKKIIDSTHYNEIVKLLLDGYSPKYVSNYLKNEYGESIGYRTIHNFRKSNLNIDEKVNQEFNKRKKEKEAKKDIDKKTEVAIENRVKKLEEVESDIKTAINKGVNIRELLNLMITDGPTVWKLVLSDPEISSDTKMKLILEAGKQEKDWIKNDNTIEINNYNGLSGLANALSKSKERNKKTKN